MTISVRLMAPADFPFAVALTDTERWGFTVDDFRRLLALSPGGCFVVEVDGDRAGLLTTFLYGEVGWIGNVIVSARLRGHGVGATIIDHAIRHLEGAGARAVRLWAYENTVSLYARFRFKEDGHTSSRWLGFGHSEHEAPSAHAPANCAVFPLNALTLQQVYALDRRYFGADRKGVLQRVAAENPGAGVVARDAAGKAVGYLVAKVSPKGCEVGPWIVDPAAAAWAIPCLLESILDVLTGQSVELGVYDERTDVHGLLIDHGFQRGFKTVRLTRGDPNVEPEEVAGICAIGALEKG